MLRGLPTTVTRQIGSTKSISESTYYNDLGKIVSSVDGKSGTTSYTYGSQNAFVASTTLPATANNIAHVTYTNHDINTGLLLSQQDFNGNTTSYTYDPRMRPLTVTRPDNSATTTTYVDPNQVLTTVSAAPDPARSTTTDLDGLGRKVRVSTATGDACGQQIVDFTYDLLGRTSAVSNPHCVSAQPTDGWTQYTYDAIGRLTTKINPDNSSQHWTFNDTVVNSYDENGHLWTRTYDAADRLTKVLEPSGSSSSTPLETDYQYDTLNNLISVNQVNGPQRSFQYDWLSRLTKSTNPEAGSTTYVYDGNSNLASKTDARNTVTYSYDTMNRLIGKTYSDATPPVALTYDTPGTNAIGQLTASQAGSGIISAQDTYTYDSVGHLRSDEQCTPANPNCAGTWYGMSYQYDQAGSLTQSTNSVGQNGSPLQLSNTYDAAGRLLTITSNWADATHPSTLFSASPNSGNPGYGPMGLQNASLGINASSGAVTGSLVRSYDDRGRAVFEADSGQTSISTTDSSGTITINGAENNLVLASLAASATFTVAGQEGSTNSTVNPDTGAVSVAVSTPSEVVTATGSYGLGSTSATVAQSLAASFSAQGFPATSNGIIVTVYANATGFGSDYSYAATSYSTNVAPFAADFSVSGPNNALSGNFIDGTTAGYYYDQGTITASISGTPVSVDFGACSTPTSLAASLASAINAQAGSFVSATSSGSTVSLKSVQGGAATDWSLTASATWGLASTCQLIPGNNPACVPSYTVSVDGGGAQALSTGSMSGGTDGSSGVVYSYSIPPAGGFDATGNLLAVNDSVMGNWSYSYDNLNRLTGGSATSVPYASSASSWSYDAYGNRLSQSTPLGGATAQYSATNNQVVGFGYDDTGNVTYDGLNHYLYDAEGRLCAVEQYVGGLIGYFYNAQGTRVAKGTLASFSCDDSTNGFTPTASYVLGPGGEQVTEFAVTGSAGSYTGTWQHSNAFDGGHIAATYHDTGTYFYLGDWLGTKRAELGANGCVSTFSSLPYGDGLQSSGNCPDATEHHFTGKERDTESGNDYFGARYYSSAMGRFMSPDWSAKEEPVPYARLDDPQTLNLYAYLMNNPLAGVDADGHCMGWCDLHGNNGEYGTQSEIEAAAKAAAAAANSSAFKAQQQNPNQAVGNTTEGSLAKVLTNEDGSLSTPKGGAPQELVDGKTDLANAIYNNANLAHPEKVAPDTGTASAQDSQIMQGVVTSRTNGGADPAQGRHYYGTSHHANLKGRSALNGLKGAAGRESVFARFGPFHDSMTPNTPTYIYIYNDPGH
jgi:RHS repeat-associated protein